MDIRDYLKSDNVVETFAICCMLATLIFLGITSWYQNFKQNKKLNDAINGK
jgi:hypothetical protein